MTLPHQYCCSSTVELQCQYSGGSGCQVDYCCSCKLETFCTPQHADVVVILTWHLLFLQVATSMPSLPSVPAPSWMCSRLPMATATAHTTGRSSRLSGLTGRADPPLCPVKRWPAGWPGSRRGGSMTSIMGLQQQGQAMGPVRVVSILGYMA